MPFQGLPDVPLGEGPPETSSKRRDIDKGQTLGLNVHASALTAFIRECNTPMTIGIQGDWGSGKTSLMRLIEENLTAPEGAPMVPMVWFNTWQYSQMNDERNLPRLMLMNLIRQIHLLVKDDKELAAKVGRGISRFAKAVATIGTQVLNQTVAGGLLDPAGVGQLFDPDTDRVDQARVFEEVKAEFASIVQDVRKKKSAGRIICFVDDLDRINPARAVELLEVIKNLIDVPGCVFVLAIDYDVVLRGLRDRKGALGEGMSEAEGRNFFDKIIQVPYRMPIARYTISTYILHYLRQLHCERLQPPFEGFLSTHAETWIDASIGRNPRAVKRLLNLYSLLECLHASTEGERGLSCWQEHLQLLVLTSIQMAYPRMYDLLLRSGDDLDLALLAFIHLAEILVDEDQDLDNPEWVLQRCQGARRGLHVEVQAVTQGREDQLRETVANLVESLSHGLGTDKLPERQVKGMMTIAEMMWRAIDAADDGGEGNGVFEFEERQRVAKVLALTKATSVGESAAAGEATPRRSAPRLSFKALRDAKKMEDGQAIHFCREDREFTVEKVGEIVARPDFEQPGFMKVALTLGNRREEVLSLTQATKRVFNWLKFNKKMPEGAELTSAELRGSTHPTSWWAIKQPDGSYRPLQELLDEVRQPEELETAP